MPRLARRFAGLRRVVRRRHRTWMASMTLATGGWGVLWVTLVLAKLMPEWEVDAEISYCFASVFALCGLGLGIFSLRARLAWILICGVPIFANGSLLCLKLLLPDLAGLMH